VAVPFVVDATFLKTSETASAEKPLLEKIIENRFTDEPIDAAGQTSADAAAMIQQFKSVQTTILGTSTLSQVFSGKLFGTKQGNYFANYLSIIQAMMTKLVNAIHKVQEAQGK